MKGRDDDRSRARIEANNRGARSETIAGIYLMVRGYRVIGRRFKTPVGEIDLIVRRGRRIAFVEVKQRPTFELCQDAVTDASRSRVKRAAAWWMAKHERYRDYEQGFDLVFVAGWAMPRHLPNAL